MSFLNQNLMLKVLLIFGIFYVSQGGCHDIPAHREVVAGALFPWRRRRQVDLCGDAQWCVPHLPCPQVQERLRPLKVCGFCIFLYSVFYTGLQVKHIVWSPLVLPATFQLT